MSLDISGADKSVQPGAVTVLVGKEHPLIMLANALPWAILISLAMEDLKRTTVERILVARAQAFGPRARCCLHSAKNL